MENPHSLWLLFKIILFGTPVLKSCRFSGDGSEGDVDTSWSYLYKGATYSIRLFRSGDT